MKKNEIKISKISLTIAGKTLELSLEEAKELQEVLDKTFPKPSMQCISQWIPSTPIIIQRDYLWESPWRKWEITCLTPSYTSTGSTCSDSTTLSMTLR